MRALTAAPHSVVVGEVADKAFVAQDTAKCHYYSGYSVQGWGLPEPDGTPADY